MASANEKKRRRPLSSPGMSSALECLTALISRFPEVDCTKLHTGYVCSDRLQTLTNNLQSALAYGGVSVSTSGTRHCSPAVELPMCLRLSVRVNIINEIKKNHTPISNTHKVLKFTFLGNATKASTR